MSSKHHATLEKERKGGWVVRIELNDGRRFWARPGVKGGQKIIYDKPQYVPDHLKKNIIPPLIDEARNRNRRGE
jgi:hypothetical protein